MYHDTIIPLKNIYTHTYEQYAKAYCCGGEFNVDHKRQRIDASDLFNRHKPKFLYRDIKKNELLFH